MAISKVHRAQTFLGLLPRSSTPVIQIVLVDGEAGTQTGTAAEQLAADIMGDIAQHGNGLQLHQGKFRLDIRKSFAERVAMQWYSCPGR